MSKVETQSMPNTGEDEIPMILCPWCGVQVNYMVVSGSLRIRCPKCGMDAFVTRLPRGQKLQTYVSRKTIA